MACCGSRRPRSTEYQPIVVGDFDEALPVVHVRSTMNVATLRVSSTEWVTGTGVAALVAARAFVVID